MKKAPVDFTKQELAFVNINLYTCPLPPKNLISSPR